MKEQILEKAREMFLVHGFKSVTMDDLANEMAISKKTIYSHFENKTQLVKEASLNIFWIISNGIDGICALELNPIEELYEIKKFVLHHLKDEKSSPQYQLQKYYPKIYEELRKRHFNVMGECIIRNVKKGMELGIYRANLNIDFVFRIYFSGVTSIKDQQIFPENLFTAKGLMDDYLEYHLRGIVTPEGRKILNKLINSNLE